MQNSVLQSTHRGLSRLFLLQGIILILVAFFVSFWGMIALYSAFLGGLIYIFGCAYVVRMVFAYSGAHFSRRIVHALYLSEAVKFVITILFFYVAIKWLYVQMLPFLLGYIVVQGTFWFSPLLFK